MVEVRHVRHDVDGPEELPGDSPRPRVTHTAVDWADPEVWGAYADGKPLDLGEHGQVDPAAPSVFDDD